MKEITLTNGGVTIVDDCDYERVACMRWRRSKQWMKRETSSRFKGVYFNRGSGKWMARLGTTRLGTNKTVYLGIFENEEDAAKAYNVAALQYFGEFAYLNEVT